MCVWMLFNNLEYFKCLTCWVEQIFWLSLLTTCNAKEWNICMHLYEGRPVKCACLQAWKWFPLCNILGGVYDYIWGKWNLIFWNLKSDMFFLKIYSYYKKINFSISYADIVVLSNSFSMNCWSKLACKFCLGFFLHLFLFCVISNKLFNCLLVCVWGLGIFLFWLYLRYWIDRFFSLFWTYHLIQWYF